MIYHFSLTAVFLAILFLSGCNNIKKMLGILEEEQNLTPLYLLAIATTSDGGDTRWRQDAYLKPSNTGEGFTFGSSVVISGDTMVMGASGESSNQTGITNTDGSAAVNYSSPSSGAVYVFKR